MCHRPVIFASPGIWSARQAAMRILVTEDEPRILSFLARGLEAEGFSVDSAADGAEALRRVGGARYDLVVLDLLLPRVNGLTVLSELRRTQPELPVVILSARADLATKLRRASLEDRTADLSDREFRLLHHLALHPGEIVSRERLLAEVWGYHFDPGSNVVEVCIRRLRKKLGPEAPIETVRHAGYRLAEA